MTCGCVYCSTYPELKEAVAMQDPERRKKESKAMREAAERELHRAALAYTKTADRPASARRAELSELKLASMKYRLAVETETKANKKK